ncbi:hypothetical protein E4U51_001799 [Claviceps purpurea]|nr:hypothetical protein E4U51_001799 [Claviceps purpurea]
MVLGFLFPSPNPGEEVTKQTSQHTKFQYHSLTQRKKWHLSTAQPATVDIKPTLLLSLADLAIVQVESCKLKTAMSTPDCPAIPSHHLSTCENKQSAPPAASNPHPSKFNI